MNSELMDTPMGTLEIQASDLGITKISFSPVDKAENRTGSELTHRCKQQLKEYFEGKRKNFELPIDQTGTDFQKLVWACLLTIPFGQTVSYRDIAERINKPKSVRAVGAANGKNQIGLIVPCHRVIGSNLTLTGYAGGLERKAWLLKHEGIGFKNQGKITRNSVILTPSEKPV